MISQFTVEDHKKLAKILKEQEAYLSQSTVDSYIKKLYKGLYIEEIERNNKSSNKMVNIKN